MLSAVRAKMKEIEAGADGFLVFDPDLAGAKNALQIVSLAAYSSETNKWQQT